MHEHEAHVLQANRTSCCLRMCTRAQSYQGLKAVSIITRTRYLSLLLENRIVKLKTEQNIVHLTTDAKSFERTR